MKSRALVVAPAVLSLFVACAEPPLARPILESTTAAAGDDPTEVAPDAVTTPAAGAREPLVVVTIFTDFQCPACPRAEGFMEALRLGWPDDVQIQYRHFPLMGSHPLAHPAGRAAAAAHRQGGYACMARALYRTQSLWSGTSDAALEAHVTELAGACGLDVARFTSDLADPRLADRVDADFDLGREAGVRGTPWVLVNGIRANLSPRDGIQPATLLKALVRREIREARLQLEAGAPRADIPRARLFGNLGNASLVDRLLR
ncbi:MAG: DsbA family protein [Deltaproteobacteria bacterium]|nr:DsbA family protein [Deltaproteobacteria bacterium]